MPLNTQILRDGKPVKMPHGWGGWHLSCMLTVALYEESPEWINKILKEGKTYDDVRKVTTETADGPLEYDVAVELATWFHYYVDWPAALIKEGKQTVKGEWTFFDSADGETLELHPGDELVMYRSSSSQN